MEYVRVAVSDETATVRLSRGKVNALNDDVIAELGSGGARLFLGCGSDLQCLSRFAGDLGAASTGSGRRPAAVCGAPPPGLLVAAAGAGWQPAPGAARPSEAAIRARAIFMAVLIFVAIAVAASTRLGQADQCRSAI